MNIPKSSLRTIRDAIHKGEVSARSVVEKYFEQIEKWNPKLKAYITLNEKALDRSIHGFCYFFRKQLSVTGKAFGCDVRGPKFLGNLSRS